MKSISVDRNARLVFITYSDTVTDRDLMFGVDEYANLGPEYRVLVDLTAVARFNTTTEGLRRVARATSGTARRSKCALIAPTAVAFGLARMYEAFCASETGDSAVSVFHDDASARQWLGIS